jgi:hypothetical protein
LEVHFPLLFRVHPTCQGFSASAYFGPRPSAVQHPLTREALLCFFPSHTSPPSPPFACRPYSVHRNPCTLSSTALILLNAICLMPPVTLRAQRLSDQALRNAASSDQHASFSHGAHRLFSKESSPPQSPLASNTFNTRKSRQDSTAPSLAVAIHQHSLTAVRSGPPQNQTAD